MSTYRIEWPCCGSVSETEAYEPEKCPFCFSEEHQTNLLREERDALVATCAEAAEMIRRCDYTPARSYLLQAAKKYATEKGAK